MVKYCKSDLIQRGWSPKKIPELLGEPDELMPNPHYISAASMQLFNALRVIKVEISKNAWRRKLRGERKSSVLKEGVSNGKS